jgi:hypothetical protein
MNGESSYTSFRLLFAFACSLVILYVLVSIPAIRALKKGTLGEDKEGRPASFPHSQFFVVFGVQTLGGSMFIYIMKWLLDAFVCNYNTVR